MSLQQLKDHFQSKLWTRVFSNFFWFKVPFRGKFLAVPLHDDTYSSRHPDSNIEEFNYDFDPLTSKFTVW
jgi:hypothetical protein